MKSNKKTVIGLIILVLCFMVLPFIINPNGEYSGSDDQGSQMISEIQGKEVEPWFTPVAEQLLGHEIPGETESLLFSVQTGIGVGILSFFFGRFYQRKKDGKAEA